MSSTKTRAYDFTELADYKAAIRVLRRFAPEKFSADKYPLKGKTKIADYSITQRKNIREYMRFVRPLIVYGYKLKRVNDPDELKAMYSGLYGLKIIPKGLKRIPMQVGADDKPLRVNFDRYTLTDDDSGLSREFDLATVQVSNGVRVARLHFSDIGLDWNELTGSNLADTIRYIWETWKPRAVAVQAGVSVVKREGAPNLYHSAAQVISALTKLQHKYQGIDDKSHFADWMHGLDLYYYDDNAPLTDFLFIEKRRYDERNILAKQLKYYRSRRKIIHKKLEANIKGTRLLARKAKTRKEKEIIKRAAGYVDRDLHRSLIKVAAAINKLTARMYYTESF